ncbi:hypothetical protein BASA81_005344 [Batrachochytrium salamandrivorans]|nr:hypothetical protein BASA81_005344 [Batrachochytrium salamandrivorans]
MSSSSSPSPLSSSPPSPSSSLFMTRRGGATPVRKPGKFLLALERISQTTALDVARWSPDGMQFDVINPARFDRVLMEHFPNAHPKTFFRQLSHYKIVKLNLLNGGGEENVPGSFSLRHPLFVRGQPEKMFQIKCQHRKRYKQDGEDGVEEEKTVRVEQYLAVCELEHQVLDFHRRVLQVNQLLDEICRDKRFSASFPEPPSS